MNLENRMHYGHSDGSLAYMIDTGIIRAASALSSAYQALTGRDYKDLANALNEVSCTSTLFLSQLTSNRDLYVSAQVRKLNDPIFESPKAQEIRYQEKGCVPELPRYIRMTKLIFGGMSAAGSRFCFSQDGDFLGKAPEYAIGAWFGLLAIAGLTGLASDYFSKAKVNELPQESLAQPL